MIPRHLHDGLVESLRHFPVVLLTGARQVGKSTLVQAVSRNHLKARYLTMDDRTVLDAALTNPDGFVQEAGTPAILDEIQRVPDLLRAIKLVVDRNRRPGMFLLTGSANITTLSTISETLAGRVAIHSLNPLSWSEIRRKAPPTTIDDVFSAPSAGKLLAKWPKESPPARIREIRQMVLSGGFPTPATMKTPRARRTWHDSYLQTYIERDLRLAAGIEHLPQFNRLITALALRTGRILNLSELSRDLGLAFSTLRRYFHILEQTYQVFLVQPFSTNLEKRLVRTPKVYMTDTGMAYHLTAADRWETLDQQNQAGAMIETWAAGEIRKMLAIGSWHTGLFYWRTQTGHEVDFLLERAGRVAGIEIKSGPGFTSRDLDPLRRCRDILGSAWRFGILVHGGSECIAVDERTLAVPFGVFFGREG